MRTPRSSALPSLLAVLLALASAALVAPPVAGAAMDALSLARELIDGGRPADAVPLLEEAAAGAPRDAPTVFLLGIAYHRAGRTADALDAFGRAATLAPGDGLIRYNLGAAHFALGHFDEAAEAFLAVPSRSPRAAGPAYLNAGLARYKAGRTEEAKALLARAVEADPDGASADTARAFLDRLAPAPAPPVPGLAAARRVATGFRVGREFDTNVFALPDDGTTTNASDWRTVLQGELEYRLPLSDRYLVIPHYEFYGYWYNSQNTYNYRRHRVYLRLEDRRAALRPRLTYGYDFARLGGDAYTASHWLEGRVTLRRGPGGQVWARAGVAVDEAPGVRYDYLSGNTWEAVLSGYRGDPDRGWLYGALRARYRDRGTHVLTAETLSASYTALEPIVRAGHPLPLGLEGEAQVRYEFRRYAEADTWDGPPPGSKRRVDQKVTGGLSLFRDLGRSLRARLTWVGQSRVSNVGGQAGNPRDRDYDRQRYGLFLEGDF